MLDTINDCTVTQNRHTAAKRESHFLNSHLSFLDENRRNSRATKQWTDESVGWRSIATKLFWKDTVSCSRMPRAFLRSGHKATKGVYASPSFLATPFHGPFQLLAPISSCAMHGATAGSVKWYDLVRGLVRHNSLYEGDGSLAEPVRFDLQTYQRPRDLTAIWKTWHLCIAVSHRSFYDRLRFSNSSCCPVAKTCRLLSDCVKILYEKFK